MIFLNKHGSTFKSYTIILLILIFILLSNVKVVGGSDRKIVAKGKMYLQPQLGKNYKFIQRLRDHDRFL